jgi:hypothetical protein
VYELMFDIYIPGSGKNEAQNCGQRDKYGTR